MVEILSIDTMTFDYRYEVNFTSNVFNDKILEEIVNAIYDTYKIEYPRSLVKIVGFDYTDYNDIYNITILLDIESLQFNRLFYPSKDIDDVFIYDDGKLNKPKIAYSEYHLEQISFTFDEIHTYGLEQLMSNYIRNNKGYKILRYDGMTEHGITFKLSTKINNSLIDFICYDNKIINNELYMWYSDYDYNKLIKLRNKIISCIEFISSKYNDISDEVFDIRDYKIINNLNILKIYNLIIYGYWFSFDYKSNTFVDMTYIDEVFDTIDCFKSFITNYNKYKNLETLSTFE